ncbi:hypothetical protein [Bacillus thuringiensis]|uniref:hypothetical protein n=1 Tax=Bacillus thuringiensis TaxID=1428 RepID=UPI002175F833|nr:hypothetical protein [Bacillus thuringiensis]
MSEASARGLTISVSQKLVTEECAQCGIIFAFTEDLQRRLKGEYAGKAEAWFFCPRGHQQYYKVGKSEEEKIRDQLGEEIRKRQRAEQNIAMHADEARQAREVAEHERRRANGYKGHAAKITKRAKAGVCPCCNRHFTALERHMVTKHPQFTPDCPEPLRIIEGGKAA